MKAFAQIIIVCHVCMISFATVFSVAMMFTHNFWLTVVPASIALVASLIFFDNWIYNLIHKD